MSKPLVLVTGATGHIGFRTLVEVLEKGYRARITVRKLAQIDNIKATKSIQPFAQELEFFVVPDITVPGAFDAAVKDVDYILHLASPIPDLKATGEIDVDGQFIKPAKQGTLSILESASKSSSIKRVVITASVVILAPAPGTNVLGPEHLAPVPDPAEVEKDPWAAYRASKILAYHAAQQWWDQNKPSWDLIWILPSYTQGRNELITDRDNVSNGSNDIMIEVATGKKDDNPRPSILVFVNDVAKLEVAALDTTKGKNGDRYVAAYPHSTSWSDVPALLKKLFPKAVEEGILSLDGHQVDMPIVGDSTTSTQTFGIEFEGLETMVKSLVGQYVELSA